MPTEAELTRRLPDNTLVPWTLKDAGGVDVLPTDPVSDAGVRASLDITISALRDAITTIVTHQQNKFKAGVRTTAATLLNTSGDNTVRTPTAGKKLRVYWVGMSTSQDNSSENLVQIKFGAGAAIYRWRLGNPGAFSKWEPIEGAVNEPLIVNLLNTNPVEFNYTFEEI